MAKARKEPFGRPTKYLKKYCKMLIEHMTEGYSYETFAAVCDVCKSTLYEWEAKHPDFLEAKRRGFIKSQMFWERLGVENIINTTESHRSGSSQTTKSKALNSSVYIFNMKNRFNWVDRKEEKIEQKTEFKFNYNLEDE